MNDPLWIGTPRPFKEHSIYVQGVGFFPSQEHDFLVMQIQRAQSDGEFYVVFGDALPTPDEVGVYNN